MSFYVNAIPDADRDLEQACAWYNEKQPGLGDRFVLAAREKFEVILRWPELPRAFGRKAIRKVRIPRSPYSIYYGSSARKSKSWPLCMAHATQTI